MAEYTIDKFTYNGNTYKLKDKVSGYTTNTGTVTKVSTGKGLTGGDVTTTGTIKANLNSETSLGTIGTTDKLYAVGVDANNKLCVNVPWTDSTVSTLTLASGSTAGTSLTYGGKFTLTVGSKTVSFTMPASDNTDTKVTVAALTSGTNYYPILATGTGTDTRQIDSTLGALKYNVSAGTTSVTGTAKLILGNSTAAGTANNVRGQMTIYGSTAYAHTIQGAPTAARTITLPDKTGTMALTSDVPAIILNGSASTIYSFYAPTSAGTSGYYLESNGSGAPTWTAFPTIPTMPTYTVSDGLLTIG